MLRWYIDYFGLKLHKKQLVPKKKNKTTNSDHPPPNSVLLESRKQTPVGKVPSLWEAEGFLIIRERGFKARKLYKCILLVLH